MENFDRTYKVSLLTIMTMSITAAIGVKTGNYLWDRFIKPRIK